MANFFEIRNNCSRNEKLRDLLVKSLFEYTNEFAMAVGAEGFILRPWDYGNIPDLGKSNMSDMVDTVSMSIEKVGGFFDVSKTEAFYQAQKPIPEIVSTAASEKIDNDKKPSHTEMSIFNKPEQPTTNKEGSNQLPILKMSVEIISSCKVRLPTFLGSPLESMKNILCKRPSH